MMRLFLAFWSLLWTIALPVIWLYLRKRARKDPLYGEHLAERFGRYSQRMEGAVWVHAVSLGELRSAVPLIRALLERGERVVITHFTPAGRRESLRVFAPEIAAGQVAAVWVPLELNWCFKGFFRAFRPKLGLVMEIEIWPRMVFAARDAGVPLYMCNAQYPVDSLMRDQKFPLRPAVMRGFAGALVKSALQKARFAAVGVEAIHVTGELRFDQPIPPAQIVAGVAMRSDLAGSRPVIALASVTEPEEDLFLDTITESLATTSPRPLFILIPRAPERFAPMAEALAMRGLSFARRSTRITPDLALLPGEGMDVLLGDSLGEMYFYLSLADRVVVGGGFTPKGSHNIIEPLALGKPVIVGPDITTIEYPAVEAVAAGVCRQVMLEELLAALTAEGWPGPTPAMIEGFLADHSGATQRSMAVLGPMLDRA